MGILPTITLVAGALCLFLGVMTLLLMRASKKRDELVAGVVAQAEANGERMLIAPARGLYQGSTDSAYGKIGGSGTLVLTDARLTFVKIGGGMVDVPAKNIVRARAEKSYNGVSRQGLIVVEVEGPSSELLFASPRQHKEWLAAFAMLASRG